MTNRDAEIVAKVRRAMDAFSRGDIDAALKDAHPDIEVVAAGGQKHKGAAEVRAWMEPDAFESQVIESLDIRVVGNKVLIRTRTHNKGARSGIELDALAWGVWTFDEAGLVTKIEVYLAYQEAEALEAVGLSEQDAHADS